MNIQQILDQALTHHTAGRLTDAEQLYRQILQNQAGQPAALHLLGVINHQRGDHETAIDLITKSVAINPNVAAAHNNLGNAFLALGKNREALSSYSKAVAVKPAYAEALTSRGVALHALGKFNQAEESFRKALSLDPQYAAAHFSLGKTLHAMGRLDDVVESYQRVLAIAPDHSVAFNSLGNVLQELGNLDEAVSVYRQALAIAPDDAEIHNNLGIALQALGRMDDAVACYRKATALSAGYAAAYNNLGNALQSQGKMDDAVDAYRRALAIAPNFAEVHRHLALVRKFSVYDHDIQAMEDAYAATGLDDQQQWHLAFGLGKAYEDLQRYEEAFDFFLAANAKKRASFTFSIKHAEKNFKRLKQVFTTKLFEKHQSAGTPDKTPIFILGMLRSGTSLVEQILASHPLVYGAGELNYINRIVTSHFRGLSDPLFSDRLHQTDSGDLSTAGEIYIRMIRKLSDSAPFITDKMPPNFRLIGMIKLMLPHAKIIHCRRDPMDICLSIFKNDFSSTGNDYAYDLVELGRYYKLYNDLMAHWHDVLPECIYDVHYEDMVADQEGQSRAMLDYCGLDWDDGCLNFHQIDRPVQTASAAQVRRPIYKDSVQSWKHYEKQLVPLFEALK